jgi:hypothetical protein
MRKTVANILLCVTGLAVPLSVIAAEPSAITVPFPPPSGHLDRDIWYCDAVVGTILDGASKVQVEKSPEFLRERGPGLIAKVNRPGDRLVIVLSRRDKTLSLYQREDFEGGKGDAYMYELVADTKIGFLATTTYPIARSTSVITLNTDSGVGTWTNILSRDFTTQNARVESMYLVCGSRKP